MKLDCRANVVRFLKHLAEGNPRTLSIGEPQFDCEVLTSWLGSELAAELLSALNDITLELFPRHADRFELASAFWDELVCKVAARPQEFLEDSQMLADLVNHFANRWKRPPSEFEVFYFIENLPVGSENVQVRNVEFFTPIDEALEKRAIPRSEMMIWNNDDGPLTLAATKTYAASGNTVYAAGKRQVIEAINTMRAAALCGLRRSLSVDELLQWKLSGHYFAREVSKRVQPVWYCGVHAQFGPPRSITDLGDDIRDGIRELRLNSLSELPVDIQDRIYRSMYWISHSATHEVDDHKFVDLCTAMEILLLPEEELVRQKGSAIALRYNLLGGTLIPSSVKWMYDRRNDVVHGTPLPVVGPRGTWELRLVCYATISLIVHTSAERPELLKLLDLINTHETEEKLKAFIKRFEYGYEDSSMPKVVKEAQERLKRLSKATSNRQG